MFTPAYLSLAPTLFHSVSTLPQVMYNVCNCFYLELKHLLATLQRSVLAFKTPSQARHLAEVRHTHPCTSEESAELSLNLAVQFQAGVWAIFYKPHASTQRTPSPHCPPNLPVSPC